VDLARLLFTAFAFGLLITAQVALVVSLALRPPRWRALLACLVPPLAVYFGWQARLRAWASVWLGSLVAYATALLLSGSG
jgi:hypothetical protein